MRTMKTAAWVVALAVASMMLIAPCFALNNPTVSSIDASTAGSLTVNWTWTAGGSGTFKNWSVKNRSYSSPTTYTELGAINAGTNSATRSYTKTPVAANAKWAFAIQAIATVSSNNSAVSPYVVKYSLQNTPDAITFGTIGTDSIAMTASSSATGGLRNLDWDSSGVIFAVDGTDQTKVQSASTTASGLTANTQYTFKAKGVNGEGVETAYSGDFTKYTAAVAPTFAAEGAGAVTCDQGNLGGQYWIGTTFTFDAVNGFGAGADSASAYKYFWNTTATTPTDFASASDWTAGSQAFTPTELGTYYLHLVALNGDGLATAAVTSAGYEVVPEPGTIVAAFGLLAPLGFAFRRRRHQS